VAGVPVPSCVLDQHVDAGDGGQLANEPPHLALGGQIGGEGVHFSAACQTYFFGGFFRAFGILR
jgi:hypothetical protein